MTRSVRILCCMGPLASFAGIAAAAEFKGILIDKMCSAEAVSGGQKAAAEHDRECALTTACQKSGYGVYTTDNKRLDFDAVGNQKALKASKKSDNLTVTVTGDATGDTIKVASLKLQ